MWKLWPVKICKYIGKRLAVIGNQYVANRYQYIITLVACVIVFLIDFVSKVFITKVTLKENYFKWNLQRDKLLRVIFSLIFEKRYSEY